MKRYQKPHGKSQKEIINFCFQNRVLKFYSNKEWELFTEWGKSC